MIDAVYQLRLEELNEARNEEAHPTVQLDKRVFDLP